MAQQKRIIGSLFGGAILGAIVGGIFGWWFSSPPVWAIVFGVGFGISETVTTITRKPGGIKPLWYRILTSSLIGAAAAIVLNALFSGMGTLVLGIVMGGLVGLIGLQIRKIVLGLVVGALIAFGGENLVPSMNPPLIGGAVVLVFRILSAVLFQKDIPIQLSAERVPKDRIPYVVPFEANSNYIGADFFKDMARDTGGSYKRNQPGIGIVETMETLRGPHFDPDKVHPLIREFYEHTSRFKLQIIPEWNALYRPLFWIFKQTIAQPLGQANLPFNQEEAQKGMVSYIDTINFSCNDIIDLRAWVRAFEATGEALYVGVYTTFRWEDVGYVSVGFPLPESNFTATLLPYYLENGNFILKSRNTGMDYPGHYLSTSEGTDALTVLKLPTFHEEIEVFIENGELRTQHRFYLGKLNFLKLHYSMERVI